MNKEYKIKLDLNKKLYNKKMMFNQFDENVNDFYIEITKNNEVVKDLDKSIITLVAIKPNGEVDAQFIEVKEGQIYADLKPSMCDLVGNYQAKAMITLDGEIVTTDTINYSVNEDKIISRLNDDVVSDERFTLFTDALARLSTIETSEEQRMINEAERILAEENRKIEEAKRVEAELVRQHEEADRAKYDATRESNENIRKQNESIRLANETNRIDEESKRVEEENKRKLAEEERNANYNFMTEDEERRRSEANAHKEAEVLRVQAETNRVNEEAKRRTIEQGRVSAENTRVSNENTRKSNEIFRENNETQRIEAETQRQSRYNSFITDAEANANNFENYTNTAKVKEEERKSNELDRRTQETKRVSNEVERISNENTRKANEVTREENEASRQNTFTNKVNEVDTKISELNTTKDNFVSSINTKVDTKISEIEVAKSDMTNTVSNKVNEVETRFNALTSSQQQDAEVIDARDGETSLKARLDRDIEKAKQVYVNIEGSYVSTDSSVGYAKDVEILGNTVQDTNNLADIRSVGDKVEGQELYEIPVLSYGKNLIDKLVYGSVSSQGNFVDNMVKQRVRTDYIEVDCNKEYRLKNYSENNSIPYVIRFAFDKDKKLLNNGGWNTHYYNNTQGYPQGTKYVVYEFANEIPSVSDININSIKVQLEEGKQATPYEPYQEDKLTILSPVQLEKVGDVSDRIVEKDGVWGVEKNVETIIVTSKNTINKSIETTNHVRFDIALPNLTDGGQLICNKLVWEHSNNDNPHCWQGISQIAIFIPKAELETYDVEGCKKWIDKQNQLSFAKATTQPQFIPLPHSQQIKLRTFANKTNISFGCEIEGTIKAQVPKSLGATVNTHTEQISNLNKELDRVKKLEESTVSTVTTESDFTTVEATSNGYFEDVKLEGKTLVNLAKENYTIPKTITGTISHNKDLLKPNTEYTVNFEVVNNNLNEGSRFVVEFHSGQSSAKIRVNAGEVGRFTKKITTSDVVSHVLWVTNGGSVDVQNYIILEGDHTQNPPSYFEGLKSVGDGADEIVVSSVKGDGNLFDLNVFETLKDINNWSGDAYKNSRVLAKLKPNTTYTMTIPELCVAKNSYWLVEFMDAGKSVANVFNWSHNNSQNSNDLVVPSRKVTFTTSSGHLYINAYMDNWANLQIMCNYLKTNFMLEEGTQATEYTPHQSDKKRLLYYNEETQTWEKPILREWDSIEKHADGKYYYHQRSAEVVLNGSENWSISGHSNWSSAYCTDYINMQIVGKGNTLICDRLTPHKSYNEMSGNDLIGITVSDNGYFAIKYLPNSDTKPTPSDVKQWLQANNVTVVYQLAQEKVYECTNIDLITYANETNYIVESGAIVPRTTLKVHNNISNVVSLLQKKVSLLESNVTSYMITQNRLMLTSRYNADTVSFKVDVATLRNSFEYDNDLYELILNNILVGKDNYNREYIENLIIFYWMDFIISDEMYSTLFEIIEEQHNPKIEEETPLI